MAADEPFLRKPACNSAMEIVPELSVSNDLNISLKPSNSSGDNVFAMATKPNFLNLVIAANDFNRFTIALSNFLAGAPPVNHG